MHALKAIVAAIGGLCTAVGPILADNVLDWSEYGTVASALALAAGTVYGVWRVPNKPIG
ncbi:hypothetical protein [Amycolatopsis methanolica]|uniref:Uncharacterized protein n=1 Tax=Amycolatopsis methanolica 239 TaxID=1068978 RepID=A0A076N6D9_AMYME|nr:hypothetical protein [Amycolatopsis methanolica]AIJ26351.1 hypothetical protein AMETH_6259 [Amycolatopsis methanolica 239]AIJ26410.1 hypothetical protein AMETH_6318 [Amycolatopsis methanolica 239]